MVEKLSEDSRGHDFAEAIYELVAARGPADLSAAERNAIGDALVEAAVAWVRVRNVAARVERGSGPDGPSGLASGGKPPLDGWRPMAEATPPTTERYISVRTISTYRWLPYKPDGARQMKKPGRWQIIGEYGGWQNAELPEGGEWRPHRPGFPSPAPADQPPLDTSPSAPLTEGE